MEFEVGKKYTTFEISDFMACTVKREIVIKDKDERGTIFALKGKRKRFYTKCDKSTAVFEGHDLDLKADSDTGSSPSNALLNFVGTTEFVKDFVENNNLNEELDKDLIVAIEVPGNYDTQSMVYPELYVESNHACADTIIKKQLVTA